MSVSTGMIKLRTAIKALGHRWDETGEQWDDTVRSEFEENYLEEAHARVEGVLREMERLAEVLAKARRQCEAET